MKMIPDAPKAEPIKQVPRKPKPRTARVKRIPNHILQEHADFFCSAVQFASNWEIVRIKLGLSSAQVWVLNELNNRPHSIDTLLNWFRNPDGTAGKGFGERSIMKAIVMLRELKFIQPGNRNLLEKKEMEIDGKPQMVPFKHVFKNGEWKDVPLPPEHAEEFYFITPDGFRRIQEIMRTYIPQNVQPLNFRKRPGLEDARAWATKLAKEMREKMLANPMADKVQFKIDFYEKYPGALDDALAPKNLEDVFKLMEPFAEAAKGLLDEIEPEEKPKPKVKPAI